MTSHGVHLDRADLRVTSVFTVLYFSGAFTVGYGVFTPGSPASGLSLLLFVLFSTLVIALATSTAAALVVGYPLALLARRALRHVDQVWVHLVTGALVSAITALAVNLVYLAFAEPWRLADSVTSGFGVSLIALAAISGPLAWLQVWRRSMRVTNSQPQPPAPLRPAAEEHPVDPSLPR
ncbi:MAG: hypothetical protein V4479_02800 [Actinomycetota bacterium]